MQVELRKLKFIAKLANVFIFILIFSIPFSTIAHSSTNTQQRLDTLNQQIDSNKQKVKSNNLTKSQLDASIKQLDSKMYGIKTRLDALQTQLGGVRDKVSATRAELDKLQAELARKQIELKAALKELKRLSAILDKRASNYYKSGRVSYLEVILSAKSFSDLIHQVDYLSTVVDQDAKFVREIKDTRATIEAAKATIEKNKTVTEQKHAALVAEEESIASLTADQQKQKDSMDEQVKSKQDLIAKVSSENKQLAADLNNEEGSAASLTQQMNSSPSGTFRPVVGVPSISGFIWPCGGRGLIYPGGEWGNDRGSHIHAGIDISVGSGTPVLAVKAGTVSVGYDPSGYGNYIDVNHGGGWVTRYAHLRRVIVSGGYVAQGQQIADSGGNAGDPGAGSSRGAHLHFELRNDGGGYGYSGTVNPLSYLP